MMFVDKGGRRWSLAINAYSLRAVSQKHGVEIVKASGDKPDKPTLDKLGEDIFRFLEIVYDLSKVDDGQPRPSFDEFLQAMEGEQVYDAGKAFYLALANFSQPHLKGLNEAKVKAAERLIVAQDKEASEKVEAMDAEALSRAMRSFGGSSGESVDSSASTPAP